MKIRTTQTHISTQLRISPIAKTLERYGHTCTQEHIKDADIWLVDCMQPNFIDNKVLDELIAFKNDIILISLGDWASFKTNLPDEIINKSRAFCKIQWDKDDSFYDQRIIGKQVVFPPFLINTPFESSICKSNIMFFNGLPTGELKSEDNIRIKACKLLKNKKWFHGGITGQEPGVQRDISCIRSNGLPRQLYLKEMNSNLYSLCLPGNSVLTYRHFESMALMCCIITCMLNEYKWLNKMVEGYHYIEVKKDLSNLIEICESVMLDEKGSINIAKHGFKLYNEYYRLMPDGGLTKNMWHDITQQLSELGIDF